MFKFKILTLILFFLIIFSSTAKAEIITKPEIKGETAITIDADSKEIIYTKNIDKRMYPASTTKLMTALLLAENKNPDYIFKYTKSAKSQEQFSLDLPLGDEISADDAMKAMLLFSANDIAYLVGEDIGGGNIQNFADLMNKKVQELKLENTHFVTPNGLHDENHYSSAYDLSVIAMQLYKYPWIMSTMLNSKATIKTSSNLVFAFDNRNKLIGKNGCIGGKTGFTSNAGRCLVALYNRNNRNMIGVIMKSGNDLEDDTIFNDMEKIIDWSYSDSKDTLYKKSTAIKTVNVNYTAGTYKKETKAADIPLTLHEDITRYNNGLNYDISYNINDINPLKLDKNKSIGTITITEKSSTHSYSLYPAESNEKFVAESKALDNAYLHQLVTIALLTLLGVAAVTCTVIFIVKKKRVKGQ